MSRNRSKLDTIAAKADKVLERLREYVWTVEEQVVENWEDAFDRLRAMPRRSRIKVLKENFDLAPPWKPTRLGMKMRSLNQYRSDHKFMHLHVREYKDHYVLHIDLYSPKNSIKDMVKHWMHDTPEYFAIVIILIIAAIITYFYFL